MLFRLLRSIFFWHFVVNARMQFAKDMLTDNNHFVKTLYPFIRKSVMAVPK